MLSALRRLFTHDSPQLQAAALYVAAVNQARQPVFYAQHGVPDTVDGRFEMIVLHLFLLIERIRQEPQSFPANFSILLTDAFFADMDRGLREMGVGDTGVGKRIKNMGEALYGRMKVYRESLQDTAQLAHALQRNAFGTLSSPPDALGLADYLQRNKNALQNTSAEDILAARLQFV